MTGRARRQPAPWTPSWTLAQLEARTVVDPDTGCWLWTRAKHQYGYGVATVDGRTICAHRLAAWLAFGPPPNGTRSHALHSCDRPACCNPAHLRWGSPADNVADALERGRQPGPRPTCRRGHPRLGPTADVYRTGWGQLVCRACRRQTARQRRAERRAA